MPRARRNVDSRAIRLPQAQCRVTRQAGAKDHQAATAIKIAWQQHLRGQLPLDVQLRSAERLFNQSEWMASRTFRHFSGHLGPEGTTPFVKAASISGCRRRCVSAAMALPNSRSAASLRSRNQRPKTQPISYGKGPVLSNALMVAAGEPRPRCPVTVSLTVPCGATSSVHLLPAFSFFPGRALKLNSR